MRQFIRNIQFKKTLFEYQSTSKTDKQYGQLKMELLRQLEWLLLYNSQLMMKHYNDIIYIHNLNIESYNVSIPQYISNIKHDEKLSAEDINKLLYYSEYVIKKYLCFLFYIGIGILILGGISLYTLK